MGVKLGCNLCALGGAHTGIPCRSDTCFSPTEGYREFQPIPSVQFTPVPRPNPIKDISDTELVKQLVGLPIYKNVLTLLLNQQRKGLSKYGELMSIQNWTLMECIDHAQQECLDTLV